MIMVDVLVPPLDKVFDFEVDEKIEPKELREDVEELIAKSERVTFGVGQREIFLYRIGEFLQEGRSLKTQGVINGDRLILV